MFILSRQFVHENYDLRTTKSVSQLARTIQCLLGNPQLSPVVITTGNISKYFPPNCVVIECTNSLEV